MKLHYIHDPMCGWCYGAAPLVAVARELLPVEPHGGGMMAGPNRRPVTPELRAYVTPHDQRIAQSSGQRFGERYRDVLLRDTQAVLDSEPPITAMLAADEMAGRGLDMLARIQHAHYVEGLRVADPQVLAGLAAELGMDRQAFEAAYARASGPRTQAHIAESRALLARVGGSGFPTMALEDGGRLEQIDVSAFLGRPQQWREWLNERLAEGQARAGAAGDGPSCSIDGC
jgi:putative protein-disulfide isomerase